MSSLCCCSGVQLQLSAVQGCFVSSKLVKSFIVVLEDSQGLQLTSSHHTRLEIKLILQEIASVWTRQSWTTDTNLNLIFRAAHCQFHSNHLTEFIVYTAAELSWLWLFFQSKIFQLKMFSSHFCDTNKLNLWGRRLVSVPVGRLKIRELITRGQQEGEDRKLEAGMFHTHLQDEWQTASSESCRFRSWLSRKKLVSAGPEKSWEETSDMITFIHPGSVYHLLPVLKTRFLSFWVVWNLSLRSVTQTCCFQSQRETPALKTEHVSGPTGLLSDL